MGKQKREFVLLPGRVGRSPKNLTEARKIVSTASMNRLQVGEMIHFQGMGNPLGFFVKRVR